MFVLMNITYTFIFAKGEKGNALYSCIEVFF